MTLGTGRDRLRAIVAPQHGGELVSLTLRTADTDRELLYRALDFCDRPGWEGKAPVLWPATGRNFAVDPATLAAGTSVDEAFGWIWHGQRRAMPIHGFARAMAWHLDAQAHVGTTSLVRVSLGDSAQTRPLYPFGFRHTITYELTGSRLTVRHDIVAARDNPGAMPFSIGNHLTLATAALRGGADGPVVLSSPASRRQETDRFGRPAGPMHRQPALRGVPLTDLGRNVAISLGGYPAGGAVATVRGPDGVVVSVEQARLAAPRPDAIRFNLWGDPEAGYFAIEPWYGRQNSLADASGIVRLKPGAHFRWSFTISVRGR